MKRSKKGKCSMIRYDVDKLLNPKVKEKFQKEIKEKLAKIYIINQSINVSYNEKAEIITNASDITLGKVRKKKHVWIPYELLDLCNKRIRLKPLKKLSNENERKCRSVNTILRKSMKDTNEKWIQKPMLGNRK